MKNLKSVANINFYGSITVNLNNILKERGITRYRMSKLADTRFEVVDKWCNGKVDRIDSDILARFCYILDCDVSEIICYEKNP